MTVKPERVNSFTGVPPRLSVGGPDARSQSDRRMETKGAIEMDARGGRQEPSHWSVRSGDDVEADLARRVNTLSIAKSKSNLYASRTRTFLESVQQSARSLVGVSWHSSVRDDTEEKEKLAGISRAMTVTPGSWDESAFRSVSFPVIINIMSFLDPKSLCAFATTCKRMHEISHTPHAHIIWDRLLYRGYPERFAMLQGQLAPKYAQFLEQYHDDDDQTAVGDASSTAADPEEPTSIGSVIAETDDDGIQPFRSTTTVMTSQLGRSRTVRVLDAQPAISQSLVRRRAFARFSYGNTLKYGGALRGGVSKDVFLRYRNGQADFVRRIASSRCHIVCTRLFAYLMFLCVFAGFIVTAVGLGHIADLLAYRRAAEFSRFSVLLVGLLMIIVPMILPLWAKHVGWPFAEGSYRRGDFFFMGNFWRVALNDVVSASLLLCISFVLFVVSVIQIYYRASELSDMDWHICFLPMHISLLTLLLVLTRYWNDNELRFCTLFKRFMILGILLTFPLQIFLATVPLFLEDDQRPEGADTKFAAFMAPIWIQTGFLMLFVLIFGVAMGRFALLIWSLAYTGLMLAFTIQLAAYVDCSINQGRGNDAFRKVPRTRFYKQIDEETGQEIWTEVRMTSIFIPLYILIGIHAVCWILVNVIYGQRDTPPNYQMVEPNYHPRDGTQNKWQRFFGWSPPDAEPNPCPWRRATSGENAATVVDADGNGAEGAKSEKDPAGALDWAAELRKTAELNAADGGEVSETGSETEGEQKSEEAKQDGDAKQDGVAEEEQEVETRDLERRLPSDWGRFD